MKTNRDLYLRARSIGEGSKDYPLRDYLRALHALATLPLERVFTPEALREHRLEHPKSTPRTPPQEP